MKHRAEPRGLAGPLAFPAALVAVLAALVPAGGGAASRSLEQLKRDREHARRKHAEVAAQLSRVQQRERRALAEIQRLDQDLAARRAELRGLRDELAAAEAQLAGLRRRESLTVSEQDAAEARLGSSLRAWQMAGRRGPAAEIALRYGRGESDRLAAARSTRRELAERAARQADQLARLGRLRRSLASKERDLARARKAREAFLARLRRETARLRAAAEDLQASQRRLAGLVDRLAREARDRAAVVPAPARLGTFEWPVEGRVLRKFGRQPHPEFNATVFSSGVVIGSKEGTPVRAADGGRVAYLDWLEGYGRVLIVDHENGFHTVYGHLQDARVPVGSRVTRGAVIGTVGDPLRYLEAAS
jgi:septal ring factor EnvC (AmiA/AmiB activator)